MFSRRSVAAIWMAMLIAVFPASANAQSVEEYADGWTEARRGDRTWMQRATEQLTTGPVDRMFGPPAEGAMKEIINRVISKVEAMYEQRRDPCLAAAVNRAHDQTLTIGRQEVMQGATEMLFSAAGGAAGGGEIRDFLGRRLFQQVTDKLKEKALEKFKKDMREAMKAGLPVHYESDDNRNPCTTEFRIIWDKAAERYDFLFAGDCACNMISCGKQGGQVPLRRWTLTGWGTVIPEIEQLANGDKKVTWMIGQVRDATLTADCCVEGDRRFRTDPRDGGGNAWVGFERTPQTAPPQTQPPTRPQTGGNPPATGQTGTTGTTPRPTLPPRIDIPVIPDGPLTDAELERLEQRVFDAEALARSERSKAETRVVELQRSGATAEAIAEAQAAAEAAGDIHRRAMRAQRALTDKVNQQQPQEQQQQEEQISSAIPLDPVAARILAVHNRERIAVGARPLQWDPALAASASAYAQQLARGGPFVHAPRAGRENERENLTRGLPGASPEQMMVNWTGEKRNFVPGTYPNVSKTGNWYDVSHYTQMIWPTTTRVGCGTARGAGQEVMVCRYTPPGNREGRPLLADNATVVRPDLPRLPVGGGMQQIDPPLPPRPTAADPAPDGNEALHPLATLFAGALNRHYEALRNCDAAAARRALDEMRYALGELRKRLKDARAVGGFSTVNPDELQRLIDGLERVLRGAEQRSQPGTCPPR